MSSEVGAKTIFTLTCNAPFMYHWRNSQYAVREEVQQFSQDSFAESSTSRTRSQPSTPGMTSIITETYLRFTVDSPMKDEGTGFVFGNDQDACDVYVNGVHHISGRLFAITINPQTGALLLKNLARRGINIKSHSLGNINLTTQRALLPEDQFAVLLPEFRLWISVASHRRHPELHQRYWEQFCARLTRGLPGIADLNIFSHQSSSNRHSKDVYLLQDVIGRGNFGTVYRATHKKTGEAFAVKQFRKDKGSPLKEAAILQGLAHPNIVRYVDFISPDRAAPLLVMELVPGSNLVQAQQTTPLGLSDTQSLATQLLRSLQYLHGKHITHRDLKPANILVEQRFPITIKVTDFGLASARSTSLTTFCGSELYLAPEIFQRHYSNKVDLWSVGVIVLELTAGLPSYKREDRRRWPARLRDRLQAISDVTACQFVETLLQEDPHHRPTASESLQHCFLSVDLDAWTPYPQTVEPQEAPTQIFAPQRQHEYNLTEILYGPGQRVRGSQAASGQLFGSVEQESTRGSHRRSKGKQVAGAARASDHLQSTRLSSPCNDDETVPAFASLPTVPNVSFRRLEYKGHRVTYMADKRLVNVAQILNVYQRRSVLAKALRHLKDLPREIVRGGRGDRQGTYVSFDNAHRILRFASIRSGILQSLAEQVKGATG